MAGFSIILIALWMGFVLLTGFGALIFLVVSLILFLVKRKAKNGGKAYGTKGAAIVFLVLGCLLLLPLGITACGIAVTIGLDNMKKIQTVEAIENKIYVQDDEWENGFDYEGRELVPVSFFINDEKAYLNNRSKNIEKIGVLVPDSLNTHYEFYQMENSSGYGIYYVKVPAIAGKEQYFRAFVDRMDYDAVLDYYGNASLSIKALWKSAPVSSRLGNTWKNVDLNLDERREELFFLLHAVLDHVSDRKHISILGEEDYDCIRMQICSEDGVLAVELCLYAKEEEMILYLNDYEVEREIVEEYKEMLFSLMGEVQTELLLQ